MTSATVKPSRGTGGHRTEGHGLLVLASVLLLVLGSFNLLDGIAAVARSHVFIANAHHVIGDLRAWGWIVLIIGGLQVLAGVGVLTGNQIARWLGVALVGLNALGQFFFIPAYPFWSLTIIAVNVVALYALCVYAVRGAPGIPEKAGAGVGHTLGGRFLVDADKPLCGHVGTAAAGHPRGAPPKPISLPSGSR